MVKYSDISSHSTYSFIFLPLFDVILHLLYQLNDHIWTIFHLLSRIERILEKNVARDNAPPPQKKKNNADHREAPFAGHAGTLCHNYRR
jgi:hypothetical protein